MMSGGDAGGMGRIRGRANRRVRRSAEQWARLIEDQARSRLSIVAFCREHGIGASNFHYWRRRLAGPTEPTESESRGQAFVRLRVSDTDEPAEGVSAGDGSGHALSVVVRFVDGVELRVGGSHLAELVTLLRQGPARHGGKQPTP